MCVSYAVDFGLYGGSGIVTIAVIQSRAQMVRTWGIGAAKAIWDSCTITGILGGSP